MGPAATKDNNPLNIPVDDSNEEDEEMHQEDEELSAYLRGKKTPGLRLSTVNVDEVEKVLVEVEDFTEVDSK